MTHFELIFIWCKVWMGVLFLYMAMNYLLRKLIHWIAFVLLSKFSFPICVSVCSGFSILFHWSVYLYINTIQSLLLEIHNNIWNKSSLSYILVFLFKMILAILSSCPTLCDPMDCSMPGLSVLHSLPEFAQTHVHWVDDAI